MRGLQDMKTPLWIATGMSLLNIALDAVLIFGLGPIPALGIAGAAWATVVSQGLAAVVAIDRVIRRLGFTFAFDLSRARALFVVGRDMVIRTGSLLLFLVISTRVALQLGAESGAAHQAIRQSWMLIAFLLDAYAATAQSLIGYFIGAGRLATALRVAKVALGWGVATGAALAILLLLAEGGVAALLVPREAWDVFASAWLVFALSQPLNAISFVTDGIHWGTKDYAYLRNAMVVSGVVGLGLLYGLSVREDVASLELVWGVTAVWVAVRAGFGWIRIWPGVGAAPLRPDHAQLPRRV
jgi:MATE family multidrug resistance protein